jgi:hypothetical protein
VVADAELLKPIYLADPTACLSAQSLARDRPVGQQSAGSEEAKSPETRVAAPCPRSASCKVSVLAPGDQVSASHAAAAAWVLRRSGRSRSNQPCEFYMRVWRRQTASASVAL